MTSSADVRPSFARTMVRSSAIGVIAGLAFAPIPFLTLCAQVPRWPLTNLVALWCATATLQLLIAVGAALLFTVGAVLVGKPASARNAFLTGLAACVIAEFSLGADEPTRGVIIAVIVVCCTAAAAWLDRRTGFSSKAPFGKFWTAWIPLYLHLTMLAVISARGPVEQGIAPWSAGMALSLVLVLGGFGALHRRRVGGNAAVLAVASVTLCVVWWRAPIQLPADAEQPNVIVISVDTLRADHLGCYGNERVATPHLDQLAADGVLFEEAMTPVPLTNPSHSSMMTGLYPAHHGLIFNTRLRFLPEVVTLPEILAEQGYRTAAFVSGFPLKHRMTALGARFQVHEDDFGPIPWVPELWFHQPLPRTLLRVLLGVDVTLGPMERVAENVVSRVLHWVRSNSRSRFFLFLHLNDPHGGYSPPPPYDRLYDLDYRGDVDGLWYQLSYDEKRELVANPRDVHHLASRYAGEVSYVDDQLGRLFDLLDSEGLDDNTIVLFTSDHGESLTEHDYYFDHGDRLYSPSLHVPLIVRFPGQWSAGQRLRGVASLIDLCPTLLDALRIPLPREVDGVSRMSAIRERRKVEDTVMASAVFVERRGKDPAARLRSLSLRNGEQKYIVSAQVGASFFRDGTEELFDLAEDPGELRNTATEEVERVEKIRGIARRFVQRWRRLSLDERGELSEGDLAALRALGYADD